MLFMFTIDLFVQLSFLDKHRHEPGYFKVNLHHSECKLFKGYFLDQLSFKMKTFAINFPFILFCHNLVVSNNLTFENKTLPWINATQYCRDNGLVMASNESEIKTWLKEKNMKNNVWLGKYEEFTEWAYIKGCYDVTIYSSDQKSNVQLQNQWLCQTACKDKRYFGVKGNACICLQDVSEYPKCQCNNPNCVTIWEHLLDLYAYECVNQTCQCLSIQSCKTTLFERKYGNCGKNYYVVCDNEDVIGFSKVGHKNAANECYKRGSFIKWFTRNDCPSDQQSQIWTSGIRERHAVILHKYNVIEQKRLLKCYYAKNENNFQMENCEKEYEFFCRKETADDIIEPATTTKPKAREQNISSAIPIAIGVVCAMLTVIAVITFRRQSWQKLRNNSSAQTTNDEKQLSSESSTVSNLINNKQKPSIENIQLHKNNKSFPACQNGNRASNYSLAKPTENINQPGNYSFAQPFEPDDKYVYNSEYDHLNSTLKLTTGDSDYLTSTETKVTNNDKIGAYDHLDSLKRKEGLSDESISNYDHLPTNTGSDPTYDVSGRMIHDDGGKYDHLPSNIRSDPTSDYQSTSNGFTIDNNYNYDHFVGETMT